MVKHLRVLSSRPEAACGEDCPHDEAGPLWQAAQQMFAARARELLFLRVHGQPRRQSTTPQVRDRAAEMRA
jgi:hypothetical protein